VAEPGRIAVTGPALAVRSLTKTVGAGPTKVEVLRGIDLIVEAGEFVAVMGPSGSGKSTLLHLAAGLDVPTGGTIAVGGVDLSGLDDDALTVLRRQRIGLIFQSFHLIDVLTAAENVALPLAIGGTPAPEAAGCAHQALEQVGLAHRGHHLPSELSGGEQQRVAIARALVGNPLLLLADEPTGNLDSDAGRQVMTHLRQLADRRGQAILMVTHDAERAAAADRCLHMTDGRLTPAPLRNTA